MHEVGFGTWYVCRATKPGIQKAGADPDLPQMIAAE